MRKDPELDAFTNSELSGVQYPIWMGTSCHAACFPVVCIALFRDTFASKVYAVNFFQRDNSEYTMHVCLPDDPDDDLSEEWNFTVPREKLRFSGDSKWEVRSGYSDAFLIVI